MKKALIHYFSGTGNTFHMVHLLGDRLVQQGYEVAYANIEQGHNHILKDYSLHIFAYPIYGFGTPSIVLGYLNSMGYAGGCQAAIVCCCAGFEGQSLPHVREVLKGKGFHVFLTDIGIYPDSWTQVVKPVDEELQGKIFHEADKKIVDLADKLANQETSFKVRNPLNLTWSALVFLLFTIFGRRILGKVYIADSSCTSCGNCQKVCPAKVIELKRGKPRWNWRCESCQRCMNICPAKSIQTSVFRLSTYLILEIGLIFVVMDLNRFWHLNIFINILLYLGLNVITHYLIDMIFFILEGKPVVGKLMEMSYTKGYRQYLAEEFKNGQDNFKG